MVKKAILLASAVTLFGGMANAQHGNFCATDQVNNRAKEIRPEIAVYEQQLEAQIERQLKGMDLSKFAKTTGLLDTTYYIPMVVHIIHNYGNENISDNAIYTAVKEINTLYGKQNADTADVIATYKGNIPGTNVRYIGKSNIVFRLAQKDPQGRPTRGITRTRSYLTTNGGDQSKLVQWAPNAYLNVWVLDRFSVDHSGAAAYAYKPASAEVFPYADGPIVSYNSSNQNINYDNTLAHEIGHYLNLDHPWGGTNNPEVACGDDAVDDTPPTMGHLPSGCFNLAAIYDSLCTYTTNVVMGNPFMDTSSHTSVSSTSTTDGIAFDAVTAITLNNVRIYPAGAIGDPFTIQLLQNGNPVASFPGVISANNFQGQQITLNQYVPAGNNYKLVFSQNPGIYQDSVFSTYNKTLAGAIQINNDVTLGRYNFFYALNIKHGFFKIYDSLSAKALGYPYSSNSVLINYPDTTNAQNVMDYTYCSKMFTNGQVLRMRATLKSAIAGRKELVTPANLQLTGITDANGNVLPIADVAPVADFSLSTYTSSLSDPIRSDKVYGCTSTNMFSFTDRSWGDTISSRQWTFSNGATTPTSTSTVVNNIGFSEPGWVNVSLVANSNAGSDTLQRNAIYVADGSNPLPAPVYFQEFQPGGDRDKFPIFNYFNNQFKWEVVSNAGYYDNYSIRYRTFDDRSGVYTTKGQPYGDYDDFFTPPFNLQPLASGNCNLNFMYSGATRTNNATQMTDTFDVFVSTDCGVTWSLLKRTTKGALATAGTVASEFTASAGYGGSDWKLMSISIPTDKRNAKTLFRFRYRPGVNSLDNDFNIRGTGNNFFIDRIHVSAFPTGVNGAELENRGVVVAPNPTHEGAKVIIKGDRSTTASVVVTDVTGKVVFRTEQSINSNLATVEIPAQSIAVKGMYLVQVTTGNNKQTEKLIVY